VKARKVLEAQARAGAVGGEPALEIMQSFDAATDIGLEREGCGMDARHLAPPLPEPVEPFITGDEKVK